MKEGQITLTAGDGSEETFYVLEEAKIAGESYLLVVEDADDDSDALILKQIEDDDEMLGYDVLDDKDEITIISKYFEELLEDIDFKLE